MSVVEFRLPDVGEGIHEAEIVKWLVQEGERVQEFDPMVEVQTDKALVELPAPTSGYIGEILATPGTIAKVGDVLVRIETHKVATGVAAKAAAAASGWAAEDVLSVAAPVGRGTNAIRPKATPGVRHYARALGVPLEAVVGSGPAGRITKQDVERYHRSRKSADRIIPEDGGDSLLWSAVKRSEAPALASKSRLQKDGYRKDEQVTHTPIRVPFRGIRRATAEHVKRSAFTAPHVTAFDECDATELVRLRTRWNALLEAEGKRVSYLPFLIKATVSALKAFPFFNARLDEAAQEIELLPEYHIGIAVDSTEGLFVPVIRSADQLTVKDIADEIVRLTEGVRQRTLSQDELRGSTFTITNMGPIGGLFATPILNYPEVGILAVHQIQRKPVARDEQVVIRDVLNLSLSFDHRVIDGATSVRFLNHLKHLIENPESLMLELR